MAAIYLKGTGKLTSFIFRQLRFKIIVWLICVIGITLTVAASYPSIYKDEQSRQAASLTMENPAMVAMLGPGYDIEQYVHSIGAMFANEMLLFTAIAVAIMNILLVGPATRGDEEDGRIEMIRALSVGRLSYPSAVMIIILSVNVLIAMLTGLGLASMGIEGVDSKGSFLYGTILGVTGLLFAAISALFAQLTETSRGTTMFSFIVLIIAYLIRAIGDVSSEALSWLSPLGWSVRTGVFANNHWWPVILTIIVTIVVGVVAFYLHAIRDLGLGFIPTRKGNKHASVFLKTTFGIAVRLQLTNIMAWAVGLFVLSSTFGAILGDLELYFADIELMEAFIEVGSDYTMTEQFVALLMAIMSLISVVPTLMVVLQVKREEMKNLIENYYARAISRNRVLGNHFLLAVIVSFLMQSLIALGLSLVSKAVMNEAITFRATFASAYAYLPAIWGVAGFAFAMIGVGRKLTALVWLYVAYCFVVVYLGDLLEFPSWIDKLSIFYYIPQAPMDEMNIVVLMLLTIPAIGLAVIGFVSYNKRDIVG